MIVFGESVDWIRAFGDGRLRLTIGARTGDTGRRKPNPLVATVPVMIGLNARRFGRRIGTIEMFGTPSTGVA
jgi:hypothetical protein